MNRTNHKKGIRKQFCINGHDTFVYGRYLSSGQCKGCVTANSINMRIDPTKDSRIKIICKNGHNTLIFGRNNSRECYQCKRAKDIKTKKNRRIKIRKIMNDLKNKPCADCGVKYPPHVMDFDHRPNEIKLFTISANFGNHNIDVLLAEVKKCDVVCANCHRIRTYNRQPVKYL